MTRANLFSEDVQSNGKVQVNWIHRSPCLQILKLRCVTGQCLFMNSDGMEGKVSLLVLGGQGEFVGEGARKYSIEAGDVVVSEMSEPNSLMATTDLSLLVTVTSYLPSSCEMGDNYLSSHNPA